MRPHRQHDSLSYESDIGQEVVTIVPHHNGMTYRLGCLQDSILYFVVCKVGVKTCKANHLQVFTILSIM